MKKSGNNWIAFDFGPTEPKEPESSKKNASNKIHRSKPKCFNFNLLKNLKPRNIQDLAVHPKKIKEVRSWLEENVLSRSKSSSVLLLTGPTGCGKTATINVLGRTLGLQLVEWINPIDQDFDSPVFQTQATRFIEFFMQSRYSSLCANSSTNNRVVLVEDIPNFIVHNPAEFSEILERCLSGGLPLIFICTDVSSGKLDLSKKLFPQEVQERFNITTISFNPCSATLLKGLLKNAQNVIEAQNGEYSVPDADVVNAIISSTMGDIRCAVNQYYFASLKGLDSNVEITTTLNSSRSTKRKRGSSTTIKSMLKDEKLGFFHGIGRVLNPKCEKVNNSWRIQCDFNTLIEEFSTQPTTVNSFLQENYLNYFGELIDSQKAADILSESQIFLDKWNERNDTMYYALWIAVLGLMITNKHKVSKWNQIKAPTKIKLRCNKVLDNSYVNQTDSLYYNIIRKDNAFHTFKIQ